jgi:hypothetical protein
MLLAIFPTKENTGFHCFAPADGDVTTGCFADISYSINTSGKTVKMGKTLRRPPQFSEPLTKYTSSHEFARCTEDDAPTQLANQICPP